MLIVDFHRYYDCLYGQVIGLRFLFRSKMQLRYWSIILKVGSPPDFFGRGLTIACLNPSDISPCMSDMYITLLIQDNSV